MLLIIIRGDNYVTRLSTFYHYQLCIVCLDFTCSLNDINLTRQKAFPRCHVLILGVLEWRLPNGSHHTIEKSHLMFYWGPMKGVCVFIEMKYGLIIILFLLFRWCLYRHNNYSWKISLFSWWVYLYRDIIKKLPIGQMHVKWSVIQKQVSNIYRCIYTHNYFIVGLFITSGVRFCKYLYFMHTW